MTEIDTGMELFGNADQQTMMRKGAALREVTKEDPRYSYYGRNVAVTAYSEDAIDMVKSLSLIQGASSCLYVPNQEVENFKSTLDQSGFKTDQFDIWQGANGALEASKSIVEERLLPNDLEIITIGPDTPVETMEALDKITASCGVLLPLGAVMRGYDSPSVCLLAIDDSGAPVASAASVAFNHPKGAQGGNVWWGMLATREDRRGEGIAILLGAMAMLSMNERHGYTLFSTGIRTGNEASEKLCQKLGLSAGDYSLVAAIDPNQFASGRMTK